MIRDAERAMFYPGLDTSKLSDDELQIKVQEVSKRLAFATKYIINLDAIGQLHNLQNVLFTEQSERLEKESYALSEASRSNIIETEPDLRVVDTKKEIPIRREETRKRLHVPIISKNWKSPQQIKNLQAESWKLPPEPDDPIEPGSTTDK